MITPFALSAAVFPVRAQTNAIRYEEILVKAPFTMPPIKRPISPKKNFPVIQFGAKENGDVSEAIRKAIAACQDQGGGSASFIPSPCSSDQK